MDKTKEFYEEIILDLIDHLHELGEVPYDCLVATSLAKKDAERLDDKYWDERVYILTELDEE